MSLKIIYQNIVGSLTTDINNTAVLLPVDAATLSTLQALVNFAGGDWTYLLLTDGINREEVKVTGVSGGNLVVTRGVSLSTPLAWNHLTCIINNIVGLDAIKDIIAATPVTANVTVSGTNQATVTHSGNNYNVDVPAGQLTSSDGIVLSGQWPNINIAFEGVGGGCCAGCGSGTGSSDGVNLLNITSTILQGNIVGKQLNLSLQTPNFTGAGGVTVTGTYPNFTITGSSSSGGTVTNVSGGTGIGVSGSPTTTPTVFLQNTGVVAGTYNGVQINAQGQIVAVPLSWTPLSSIAFNQAIAVVYTGGAVNCTVANAAVGTKGVIALADSGSPPDFTDDHNAVTPKYLENVLGAGSGSGGVGSSTGDADGTYTNTVSGASLAVNIPSGKSMAIFAECVMLDGSTPLAPVAFGMAIAKATGPTVLYKHRKMTQSKQNIATVLAGPLVDTLSLLTTAVPGGSSIYSQSLIGILL